MKQKNYRDFTVGELLDSGLEVMIHKHDIIEEKAREITSRFEGTKQSTKRLTKDLNTARAWKENFEVVCFIREGTFI